jgi:hypothetical protein
MGRLIVAAALTALFTLGALIAVGTTGRQARPMQPSGAVIAVIMRALQIAGIWYLWSGR